MAKVEIIQYEGEQPRVKGREEKPSKDPRDPIFWHKLEIKNDRPEYDPETQKLNSLGSAISGKYWEAQYEVIDLSEAEIERKAYDKYIASLDWGAYLQLSLLSDYFFQLGLWARENSNFGRAIQQIFENLKINVSSVQSEPVLKVRMTELKGAIANPDLNTENHSFTVPQIAAIENDLVALSVNWTWAEL